MVIGGIVGVVQQQISNYGRKFVYSNLTNNGKIVLTDPENKFNQAYVGGVFGNFSTLDGTTSTLSNLTNDGHITINKGTSSNTLIGCLIAYLGAFNNGSTVSTINFNGCVVGAESQVSLSGGINIIPYAVYGNPLNGNYAPKINLNNFTNSTVYAPYYTE